MTQEYEVSLIVPNKEKQFLGIMPASSITFNRYNKGLLIAAGTISKTNTKQSIFMKFAARFRDKAMLEFRNSEILYKGEFCFINFDIETNIVVFGSVGPIQETGLTEGASVTSRVPDITLHPTPALQPAM